MSVTVLQFNRSSVPHAVDLHVEMKDLTGQRMVSVNRHDVVLHLGYGNNHGALGTF